MKVYIVLQEDADPYCGYYVLGVFAEKADANVHIVQEKWGPKQHVLDIEVSETGKFLDIGELTCYCDSCK